MAFRAKLVEEVEGNAVVRVEVVVVVQFYVDPNRASEQVEVHGALVMYYTCLEIGMNHSCDLHLYSLSLHDCFCAVLHNKAIVVRHQMMILGKILDQGTVAGCIRLMI